MDTRSIDLESLRSGSIGRASSAVSSFRLSFVDDHIDGETVPAARLSADFSLRRKYIGNGTSRVSDVSMDNGLAQDTPKPNGNCFLEPRALNVASVSPFPAGEVVQSENKKKDGEVVLPKSLECVSCLAHLAVFGILGVLTRYLLQNLFGPGVARVTSDGSILYLGLSSNMVGSFLMGWFGVVFNEDISRISEYLVVGLSAGYLGSLTTFSGWNQKMLDLSSDGQWVYVVLGFLFGLFLVAYSIILGVDTANGFKWLLKCFEQRNEDSVSAREESSCWLRVKSFRSRMVAMSVMVLMLGVLWGVSVANFRQEFRRGSNKAQLWLGCVVSPVGVWIRWSLARLNGRGIGKLQHLKWVPFGTLMANISAVCIMAGLATLKKAVKTETCNIVASGIQMGLSGCLSALSIFMAELYEMRGSRYPWRAYAYASFTIMVSFISGLLIYSIPVWLIHF